MGWIDSVGEYHYSHWDFPDVRYGLHADVTSGVPSLTVYDFGKYVGRDKKWRIEIEAGGGVRLARPDTALICKPEAGAAVRLVLGTYRLRRTSLEIVPVEIGGSLGEGLTGQAKVRVIF